MMRTASSRRGRPGKSSAWAKCRAAGFGAILEELPEVAVWSVCRNGLPGLARASQVTRGPLERVIPALGDIEPAGDALDLLAGASARAARTEELLECHPDSEPALLRVLSHYASIGGGVFLGNSLPIREWNLFAQWARPVPTVTSEPRRQWHRRPGQHLAGLDRRRERDLGGGRRSYGAL